MPKRLKSLKSLAMNSALPSWSSTPTRGAIIDFVASVANEDSPSYVPPVDRVATFDNDGTLWCEKPLYTQFVFTIVRLKQMAEKNPALLKNPAYKAAAEGDPEYFKNLYPSDMPTLMQLIFDSHAGMPQAEFEGQAYDFLTNNRHPRFDLPYKYCIYQPMLELMRFLQKNDFKVFIASAGGMSFMRTVSEEIYCVPRENVIGSNISFEYKNTQGGPVLLRKPGLIEPLDDGRGKPINIELHVGRPPILAAGNADGDLEMLEYTAASAAKRGSTFLSLLVRHDDAEREYAYDSGAEKVQERARRDGWLVVSMKDDFMKIFPSHG